MAFEIFFRNKKSKGGTCIYIYIPPYDTLNNIYNSLIHNMFNIVHNIQKREKFTIFLEIVNNYNFKNILNIQV